MDEPNKINSGTIHLEILNICRKNPEHPALIGDGGNGISYNYRKLENSITKIAGTLRQKGIVDKDRIGILSENCPEWAVAYLSILSAGAVVIPLDPMLKENELIRFFRTSGIKLVFCSEKMIKKADEIITLNGFQIETICLNDKNGEGLDNLIGKNEYISNATQPDDMAVIIYTSGTTGEPKGVVLTHKNIVSNLYSIKKALDHKPDEIFLSVLPMHHTFEATGGFLHPLHLGVTIVYARALNSRDILIDIKNNQITTMVGVPLLYEKMYNAIQRKIKSAPVVKRSLIALLYSLSKISWNMGNRSGRTLFKGLREKAGLQSIRKFVSGGAPLPRVVAEWFNLAGFVFLEGYGLTECSPVVTANRSGNIRFGSVGPPLPGVEIKIDNPSDDGVGEVIVKGDNNTPGYLDNPEETAELIKNGWLYTGDLGKIENDHLYITGRKKNLIISGGGKNIFPEEIETELNLSEFIVESIVFGKKKNNKAGETICAIIILDLEVIERISGITPESNQIRKIIKAEIDTVNSRIADYKRIEKFEIRLEEFEKTSTKKIKRRLYI